MRPSMTTGLLIPFYTYAGPGAWDELIRAKRVYPSIPIAAVVNPASGPGVAPEPNYATQIPRLVATGINVLGYVATGYGQRSLQQIQADTQRWLAYYGIKGVFYDQLSPSQIASYYSSLASFASFTVGNPGVVVHESLIGILDQYVISEAAVMPTPDYLETYSHFDAKNFAYIANTIPVFPSAQVSLTARWVGSLYVTSQTSDQYDQTPYLWQLLAALKATEP